MFSFLKNHPFAVEAFFNSSVVLTFAVPKEELEPMLPPFLELDIYKDTYGFIAVAMVQTTALRPKGFPTFMGNNFFLIGYRLFVNYINNAGKRRRGLYILKSETDRKKMEWLGNVFTRYQYTTTDIETSYHQDSLQIGSRKSGFKVLMKMNGDDVSLPAHSPFPSWKEARRYAGPLPFTFSYDTKTNRVLIVEGVRQNWIPKPVQVMDYHFSFLHTMHLSTIHLANAFIIRNIPYHWKKGITEQWKK